MFKKLGFIAAALGAGLFLVHMAGLTSYTSTLGSQLTKNFKRQVPLEFEIERLRHEVSQIMPEMKKNFGVIAEEMVAVENLQKDVNTLQANLGKQKENLLTMSKDLESGTQVIYYDNKPFKAERIREKLKHDYASFQVCESELKTKEALLDARQRSLDAAREQMSTLKSQKQDLEVQLAQLEAELKNVRLAQTRNKVHFDDSQLARCKATLAEIRDRLNIEKKKSELEGTFSYDEVPVDKKNRTDTDLIKEIRTHLNDSKTETNGEVVEK
jgi:peptidoglycan hydrolase CwlO-like protein